MSVFQICFPPHSEFFCIFWIQIQKLYVLPAGHAWNSTSCQHVCYYLGNRAHLVQMYKYEWSLLWGPRNRACRRAWGLSGSTCKHVLFTSRLLPPRARNDPKARVDTPVTPCPRVHPMARIPPIPIITAPMIWRQKSVILANHSKRKLLLYS